MKLLPNSVVLLCAVLALGGSADRVGASVGGPNGGSSETSTGGGDGENSGAGSDSSSDTTDGDAAVDEGNSGGYPCDEEGARFCEIDNAYECQDGQWVFAQNCEAPLTCETTTGTCVEKVCDRGERRCVDGETVQFCARPDSVARTSSLW